MRKPVTDTTETPGRTRVRTRHTYTRLRVCVRAHTWARDPGLRETSLLLPPNACPYDCSFLKTQTYNKKVVNRYFSASPTTPTPPLPAPFAQMGTWGGGSREEGAVYGQNLRLSLSPQRLSGQRRAGRLSWGPDPPAGGRLKPRRDPGRPEACGGGWAADAPLERSPGGGFRADISGPVRGPLIRPRELPAFFTLKLLESGFQCIQSCESCSLGPSEGKRHSPPRALAERAGPPSPPSAARGQGWEPFQNRGRRPSPRGKAIASSFPC